MSTNGQIRATFNYFLGTTESVDRAIARTLAEHIDSARSLGWNEDSMALLEERVVATCERLAAGYAERGTLAAYLR